MNTQEAIKFVHEQAGMAHSHPDFRPGDNVAVSYKITEGDKVRIQIFRGDVIQISGHGATKTFTVRKISNGVGVERIFPYTSPSIEEIKVLKRGHVRRAKLFYLRKAVGKKGRIKERKIFQ
ncbi:MAG: 50S ribosomal protein L19 [Saprospiraceae bacterium]|nr:50S ribosomal protein L19 [Saprospiraceae bacterium]